MLIKQTLAILKQNDVCKNLQVIVLARIYISHPQSLYQRHTYL